MYAIIDFFSNLLQTFGLFRKSVEIAFLGLDNAGKTTLLRMLVDSHQTQAPPTLHPIREEINIGNVKFITTDLGGHTEAREFWQNHYFSKNAIVFVLDAADPERFPVKINIDIDLQI
ncbi:MAG: GTP-binding protein SAR1a [Marteilia pararefringens]